MSKHIVLCLCYCFCTSISWGQSQGALSPSTESNLLGINTNWTNPTRVVNSDGSFATITNAVSNYLSTTGYGFTIPAGQIIKGIKVEVERHGAPQHVVAAGSWYSHAEADYSSGTVTSTYGTTSYTYNMPVAAGSDRLLVVSIGIENVDKDGTIDPTITFGAVKYNGVTMTLAGTASLTSSDTYTNNTVAIYYLKEADLPSAIGNKTLTITKTINGETAGGTVNPGEYTEIVGVNTFMYVDQTYPISTVTKASTGSSITSPTLTDSRAGDFIMAATMNNTPSTSSGDVTGTYAQLFKLSNTNTSTSASGAILEGQGAVLTATGTPNITVSATGSGASRLEIVAVSIHAARVYDNSIKLIKGGSMVGSDYAVSPEILSNAWPDADVVETYGGPTDLWGTSWTVADINAANFGAAFQADAIKSIGSVDQIRITVYYAAPLAVTLQSCTIESVNGEVVSSLSYLTDDRDQYVFILERAGSDLEFTAVNSVAVTGNYGIQNLSIADAKPDADFPYYRIKVVKNNGTDLPKYSSIHNIKLSAVSEIQLYPNPATSYLEIFSGDLIYTASLLDATGNTVFLQKSDAGVKSIKMETLPSKGFYTMVIHTNSGITSKRVIID